MATPYNKTASFTDYAAESEDIARRRKLAEMMQAQAFEPIQQQTAGGYVVPISWTQALSKALQGGMGAWQQSQLKDEAKQLSQRARDDNRSWLESLQGNPWVAPTPEQNFMPSTADYADNPNLPQAQVNVPAQPGLAGKPLSDQERMARLMEGASSGNPLTSPMASSMLAAVLKDKAPFSLRQGERRFDGNGNLIVDNPVQRNLHFADNGNVIQGLDQITGAPVGPAIPKSMTPEQQANDEWRKFTYNTPAAPPGTTRNAQGQLTFDPGYLAGRMQIANAGAPRLQTNVNAQLPASEQAQKQFMDSTRTTYDQLKQAPVAIDNIEKAKALIPSARGFMGPGGEPLMQAAKFLNNRLGMSIDTQGVNSAEELRTRIFFNIMDNLKKMDASPSQQQQQIMQEALGKLGTDPNALPAVLDSFSDSLRGKVDLHNQEVMGAEQRGVKFPYNPIIQMPQRQKPVPPKPAAAPSGPRFLGFE